MIPAVVPISELDRLSALRRYEILDTAPDADFDALTGLLASVFRTPIAGVTLLDANRQWFKSSVGLKVSETLRAVSFCSHVAVSSDRPLIVPDASRDRRFMDSPLVVGSPFVRFYAGMPIVAPNGQVIGAVFVADVVARDISLEQIDALKIAARSAMTLIEHRATVIHLDMVRASRRVGEREMMVGLRELAEVRESALRLEVKLSVESNLRTTAEQKLEYAATYDILTDLPNRKHFIMLLEKQLILSSVRPRDTFVVFSIDIDNFKQVNEALGHQVGDELLLMIASRLKGIVRFGDLVARMSGDEFMIIIDGIDNEASATVFAERIMRIFATPWRLAGAERFVTASIGVVVVDDRYCRASDVMRDAGIGMYSSKRRGRNCFSFFEQSVREEVVNHINIHQVLMRSVERRDFSFVYQPIAALSTRYTEVEGFEALLRFDGLAAQHSTFDMVVAAEQSGLIVEIGAWALKSACLELKRFRAATSRNLQMSVNVSARQLVDPGFVAMVKRTLAETAVDPSEIALEVTESAIMEDPDRSIMVLEELRNLGMGIHLDDFGTGYSSLSYLRRLPITRVKIDRSFVSADGQSGLVDSVIVGAIISLAHDLKLKVIAEGVETLQQRIALERLRCDAIQGYLISGPVSGLAAAALL